MYTPIAEFIKSQKSQSEDPVCTALALICSTLPSNSIVIDPESSNNIECMFASALAEITVWGNEITYDSAPGYTVASSHSSIVFRISFPYDPLTSVPPLYVVTDQYAPA